MGSTFLLLFIYHLYNLVHLLKFASASHKTKPEIGYFAHLHLCILGELNAQKKKNINDSKFDGRQPPKKNQQSSKVSINNKTTAKDPI